MSGNYTNQIPGGAIVNILFSREVDAVSNVKCLELSELGD